MVGPRPLLITKYMNIRIILKSIISECQQSRNSRGFATQTNGNSNQMHTRTIAIKKQRISHEIAHVQVIRYGK